MIDDANRQQKRRKLVAHFWKAKKVERPYDGTYEGLIISVVPGYPVWYIIYEINKSTSRQIQYRYSRS